MCWGSRGDGRTRTCEAVATGLQPVPVAAWIRHRNIPTRKRMQTCRDCADAEGFEPPEPLVHPCSKRARSTGLRQASIWPLTAAGRAPNLDRRSSPHLLIRRKPKGFRGDGRTRTREAEATDLQSVPVAAWVRHRKQGEGFPLQAEQCFASSPRWRDVGGKP